MPSGRKSAIFVKSGGAGQRTYKAQRNYVSQQSGARRHMYQAVEDIGSSLSLAAGEYFGFTLLRFFRTNSGSVDDSPPVPTASNNYQTPSIFNGSRAQKYSANITIKNRGSISSYLDVYEVAVSFYDVLVWDTLFPTACPFTFDSTSSASDRRGAVTAKTPTATLIVKNTIKNFKFLQHYIRPKGTVFVPNEDAGNGGNTQVNISRVPKKCVRSQTGMYWGLLFHNDSDLNGAETVALDTTINASFEEIPTDNRLPFID